MFENSAGVARLAAAVINVSKPPAAKSIAPLPEIASTGFDVVGVDIRYRPTWTV
jgi:hypothetical protein